MPSIKRLAEEEANSTPNASRQRIDGNDYAGSGRKKTAGGSSRTGQACDRCKVRYALMRTIPLNCVKSS